MGRLPHPPRVLDRSNQSHNDGPDTMAAHQVLSTNNAPVCLGQPPSSNLSHHIMLSGRRNHRCPKCPLLRWSERRQNCSVLLLNDQVWTAWPILHDRTFASCPDVSCEIDRDELKSEIKMNFCSSPGVVCNDRFTMRGFPFFPCEGRSSGYYHWEGNEGGGGEEE